MALQDKTDHYLSLLTKIIYQHLPEAIVILYDSRARKDFEEGSDIDPLIMSSIRSDIDESSIPILVDVVDYHAISDDMKSHVDKDGVIWKK